MKIYPMNSVDANRRHWISRTLRTLGIIDVILVTVIGAWYSYAFGAIYVGEMFGTTYEIGGLVCLVVGGLVSFAVGLLLSMGLFAMALILDDLHALRIYASGYMTTDNGER